jgi:hypothetical protein
MATESQWWQRNGNLAQIGSAVVAIIGFGAIIFQVSEIRQNNRATAARQIYLAYSDLNFRNPHFGIPDYQKIKADPLQLEQYKSFVSYLLYACGEAFYAFGNQPEWRKSCEYEIRVHLPFLCEVQSKDPMYLEGFGQEMIDFVKAGMAREGVTPPDCKLKGA